MTTASHRSPTEECDLVMKGGITSGVVYPQPGASDRSDTDPDGTLGTQAAS